MTGLLGVELKHCVRQLVSRPELSAGANCHLLDTGRIAVITQRCGWSDIRREGTLCVELLQRHAEVSCGRVA